MNQHSTTVATPALSASRWAAIIVPFLFGATLVFLTGFAHPQALHDAAHDTRHALSFPCH